MENSEMQKRIINLGRALVRELSLDPGVDTLARWMAHYVAEQIVTVEDATGDDRIEAQQHCFTTILELWQHRSSLPNGRRPFESFEPVLRALERLDPENPAPYYSFAKPSLPSSELDDSGEDSGEVERWLDVAREIDQAARVWLEYVFHQAALNAADEETIAWVENAIGPLAGDDIAIIVRLIHSDPESASEETAELERSNKQEKLRSRIQQLDAFIDLSRGLRAMFLTELETMGQGDALTDAVETGRQ